MTTPAQKRAQATYMEKFVVARVRMDKDFHEAATLRAKENGESLRGYIVRLIEEDMKKGQA